MGLTLEDLNVTLIVIDRAARAVRRAVKIRAECDLSFSLASSRLSVLDEQTSSLKGERYGSS